MVRSRSRSPSAVPAPSRWTPADGCWAARPSRKKTRAASRCAAARSSRSVAWLRSASSVAASSGSAASARVNASSSSWPRAGETAVKDGCMAASSARLTVRTALLRARSRRRRRSGLRTLEGVACRGRRQAVSFSLAVRWGAVVTGAAPAIGELGLRRVRRPQFRQQLVQHGLRGPVAAVGDPDPPGQGRVARRHGRWAGPGRSRRATAPGRSAAAPGRSTRGPRSPSAHRGARGWPG